MSFTISSPHTHGRASVTQVMLHVVYALVPAIAAHTWFFGPGMVINIAIASATALAGEAAVLQLRGRPVRAALTDGSALVTAVLLGFALPPLAPWWLVVVGSLFAIIFAKQLYGGLGQNPFNPAMAAYVLLLVSFPRQMTAWPAPHGLARDSLGILESLRYVFTGALPAGTELDAITSATALDLLKTELHRNHTVGEIVTAPVFGNVGGAGVEVVSLFVLLGGIWLLYRRVITWHVPVGMLGALFALAALFQFMDPDTHATPLFHLFAGGTMLGAFFIATDPSTGATSNRGRILFGVGVGVLVYVIRIWGSYPDAVAFAVLLMNVAAPTIDHYTRPRVFGHAQG